jgi:ribosomal protein L37AE/L43A
MTKPQCEECGDEYVLARRVLGYRNCLRCGELTARQRKHCIVPMHKSNYVPVTNLNDLRGINSKTGYFQ